MGTWKAKPICGFPTSSLRYTFGQIVAAVIELRLNVLGCRLTVDFRSVLERPERHVGQIVATSRNRRLEKLVTQKS
jgi:hypothetical protein